MHFYQKIKYLKRFICIYHTIKDNHPQITLRAQCRIFCNAHGNYKLYSISNQQIMCKELVKVKQNTELIINPLSLGEIKNMSDNLRIIMPYTFLCNSVGIIFERLQLAEQIDDTQRYTMADLEGTWPYFVPIQTQHYPRNESLKRNQ